MKEKNYNSNTISKYTNRGNDRRRFFMPKVVTGYREAGTLFVFYETPYNMSKGGTPSGSSLSKAVIRTNQDLQSNESNINLYYIQTTIKQSLIKHVVEF